MQEIFIKLIDNTHKVDDLLLKLKSDNFQSNAIHEDQC